MAERIKAAVYIGFAIKSGKIKLGTDCLERAKKCAVVIVCESASQNCMEKAKSLSGKFGCTLLKTSGVKLEDIVYKKNCKLAGITDMNLARAVEDNMEENFIVVSGGVV